MGKPIIRFKGYEDDWEQRKLGEVLVSLQNNTLSRADLSSEQGIAKNVHYGDILVKFGEVIDVKTESLPMIVDESIVSKYKASFLQNGDVILADTAEDKTVGKCAEIAGLGDEIVISGLHTIPYRPLQKFASGYLGYYMNSSSFHNQLLPLMQGIKVTSISKTALKDTDVLYPRSATEQAAIGKYFRSLDHLITLHQRKCKQTKILKKYMLQKMFPQNGEKVPEIRFAGFTDDWEQRKLGDIAQSFEYGLNAPAKEYDGTNKYLRITDIDDVSRKFNIDNLTSPDIELSTAKNYRLLNGDILFARTGASVGKSFIYRDSDGIVYFAGFLIRARIKAGYDAEFVFQNTLCESYGKYIQITSQRSGQPGVNAKEYSDYAFNLPTYDEQKKIGNFLHQIDDLITLHQRKCDELQKIKKFMLQNMFV